MESQENNLTAENKDRAYATGRKKNSIARVWLKEGMVKLK